MTTNPREFEYDDLYFGDDGLDDDELGYDQLPPDMSDVASNYMHMQATIERLTTRIQELEAELIILTQGRKE